MLMLTTIKNHLPPGLKRLVKRLIGSPPPGLHEDWSTLRVLGPVPHEHVVLDIGAHHGWFFHCWQDWCPLARVHAFEPYPGSFETMRGLYGNDARVTLNQLGVGAADGNLTFNVLADSKVSNSFLAPDPKAWETLKYHTGDVTQIAVPVTTVDSYMKSRAIDDVFLAKIDVQGYELELLRGAEQCLPKIRHIFIESGIERLYHGAPRFTEVFEFLTARGFHLMAMRAWHRGNHVLKETDMLFRRDDLAPPVLDSVIKVMEKVG